MEEKRHKRELCENVPKSYAVCVRDFLLSFDIIIIIIKRK